MAKVKYKTSAVLNLDTNDREDLAIIGKLASFGQGNEEGIGEYIAEALRKSNTENCGADGIYSLQDMRNKLDLIYSMVYQMYTADKFSKTIINDERLRNCARAAFLSESQLKEMANVLGVDKKTFEATPTSSFEHLSEVCLSYIVDKYTNVIGEIKLKDKTDEPIYADFEVKNRTCSKVETTQGVGVIAEEYKDANLQAGVKPVRYTDDIGAIGELPQIGYAHTNINQYTERLDNTDCWHKETVESSNSEIADADVTKTDENSESSDNFSSTADMSALSAFFGGN